MMYDGYWYWIDPGDFSDGLRDRLSDPTDVTIELSAVEDGEAVWTIMAEVCIEPGGAGKRMRIYTADTLDHYWKEREPYLTEGMFLLLSSPEAQARMAEGLVPPAPLPR